MRVYQRPQIMQASGRCKASVGCTLIYAPPPRPVWSTLASLEQSLGRQSQARPTNLPTQHVRGTSYTSFSTPSASVSHSADWAPAAVCPGDSPVVPKQQAPTPQHHETDSIWLPPPTATKAHRPCLHSKDPLATSRGPTGQRTAPAQLCPQPWPARPPPGASPQSPRCAPCHRSS